jgi:polyferredoxin
MAYHVMRGSLIMTLDIVAVQGYATWWIWVIRDKAGVVVEKSTIQFRSAATAELKGRARIAQLDEP